jgi:hypothetical protein
LTGTEQASVARIRKVPRWKIGRDSIQPDWGLSGLSQSPYGNVMMVPRLGYDHFPPNTFNQLYMSPHNRRCSLGLGCSVPIGVTQFSIV